MDIKERIKKLMEHEQMTAAAFADSIGVAQATISHTLGDRNKYPSTDFIMRLHERFNYISLDWLLTGKGEMINNEISNSIAQESLDYSLFNNSNAILPMNTPGKMENRKETSTDTPLTTTKDIVKQEVIYKELPSRKSTEIRVFFDDNTYQIFKPEK